MVLRYEDILLSLVPQLFATVEQMFNLAATNSKKSVYINTKYIFFQIFFPQI